ncbi:MAG: tRNA (adenosine(37)-N6)-threonylcarbamoyltransferase complex transferase subunit TsaD [Flavobacteriales bacterium]|nr:tRNA (adenosine(37)-N6)-threonylcarbamoyltransferase complex transferase subunit TsaD [Flavobacteriales bacterium]
MQSDILILGIESSCDDTSASVTKNNQVLSNLIANQQIHKKFGGVVPELASRDHQINIIPVVDNALKTAKVSINDINYIAFTEGPGLIGSLLVGSSFARFLSLSLDIPCIGINHMKAHILSNFINSEPKFPFISLTVSGGHTQLVLVKSFSNMKIIGQTLDDAVGETFDKSAKILGLEYPGGPIIDKLSIEGDPNSFEFTKPRVDGLNFSFSGLKSNIVQRISNQIKSDKNFIKKNLKDLCASIQNTIITILIDKIEKALKIYNIDKIAISGGVSANSELRKRISTKCKINNWNLYLPELQYCTDNAAMIAISAYYKIINNDITEASQSVYSRNNW